MSHDFRMDDKIPSWSKVKNPFYAEYGSSASGNLLITIGDSWTYGDSLGKTKVREGIDDEDYRLRHVYGRILSSKLQYSWANVALPGISNSLMLDWADYICESTQSNSPRIVCVITLTESGRHEDLRLIDRSLITQQRVLENILSQTYQRITLLRLKYPHIQFIVGHNFTDSLDDFVCDRTWLEVMLEKPIQNGTHVVISEHIDQMNYDAKFPDVLDIMDKASARMDLLDQCPYCFSEDSRHPNEVGHILWANYLLSKI
jgi:hypothetical protein